MAESTYTDYRNCSCQAPNREQHTYAAMDIFCMAYSNPDRCDWCTPACLYHRYSLNMNRRCLHGTIVEMSALDRFHFWFSTMRPTPSAHIRSGPTGISAYAASRSACPDSSDKFQMFWRVVALRVLVQLLPSPPMSYWWSNVARKQMQTMNNKYCAFRTKQFSLRNSNRANFGSLQVIYVTITTAVCYAITSDWWTPMENEKI